ncbi:MAG TPA: class A beta-lactamase-related serine hydrolase [Aliiroseovarius sp.]|nr:class A beta-lactamase-related serine hydrolase [Aliiroseovarius sp.]
MTDAARSQDLHRILKRAVDSRDVPFVVAMVARGDAVLFQSAAGQATPGQPAALDTMFRLFSMSKAIGALAAMILIDRGVVAMTTPVEELLPHWADLQVLAGFDNGRPVLRPAKTKATLRHLATHTSGLEYEFWNPDMRAFMAATGLRTIMSGTKPALMAPLMTDPGTGWGYGQGIDWLGQVVEAVDGRSIDEFCRQEIFEPLKMASTRFEPEAGQGRLAAVQARAESGDFQPYRLNPPAQPEFYGMGHALFGTAPDYVRFLRMILNGGLLDGVRLLSPQACAEFCADQMQGLVFRPMRSQVPHISADVDLFPGQRVTHSFGFLRVDQDVPGKRRAGSLGWAGICNTHFWIDPRADVAGVFMTQSLPFAEARAMKAFDAFERGVYAGL